MNYKNSFAITIALVATLFKTSYAQFNLTGKVKTKNDPMSFAVLSLKNTQLSAVSAVNGDYKLENLKPGTYTLVTKCVGFAEKQDVVELTNNYVFDVQLLEGNNQLDEVVVDATRVDKNNGMAFSNLSTDDIKKQNLGQDAPYMLNLLPSAVVNSDAGNGVGYTGIRIRGTDGTRINVTINGVPVNDAESQATFFVNMPDFVSSVNNIQVQRGVGTSGNGGSAFGATINFQTNKLNEKPYAKAISTGGTFNTLRNTLLAGTGLIDGKFTLDARASRITSDGYIDRASSKLNSYYLSAGYYGKKSVFKLINFLGNEKTYQAWYYVPEDSIKKGNRTYNPAGEYYDANGKTLYYKNETDNYQQNNFQLHFTHQFNSRLNLNLTGHYTKGAGYYEQYKQAAVLSNYNIQNEITAKGDTVSKSDLIRRLWLDNDFAGGIFSMNYKINPKLNFTIGGGYNSYFGKHFGRVVWARNASNSELNHEYGLYTTNKNDGNVYAKLNYKPINKLNVFIDLQTRLVAYRYFGLVDSVNQKYQDVAYNFFNPKIGVSYDLNTNINIYASLAVANKEPSGDDLIKNKPVFRPTSEQLIDFETGFRYVRKRVTLAANIYNMHYNNQLVLNGQIDNVGNPRRVNVKNSYRRGLELEANVDCNKYFSIGGNLTLSQNKVLQFTEYIDDTHAINHQNTDIAYSPNAVSSAILTYKPIKGMELSLIDKYVGKQFLDNTSNAKRSLGAYNVMDFRFNYQLKTKIIPELGFQLTVYNLLNRTYNTNGYTYSYYDGNDLKTFNYLSPAAGVYFLGGLSLGF